MAKVITSVARTDRYELGAIIQDSSTKKGHRIDRSKPRDENDKIFCLKGETYYSFALYGRPVVYTKSYPTRSQLTGSEFLSTVYDLLDTVADPTSFDELETTIDDLISGLEDLRDETEDKLSNMPDSLQYSPTGELLQSRVDELDDMISELECIDKEPDEDEDSWKETNRGKYEDSEALNGAWEEYLNEQLQSRIEELRSIDYSGE